MATPRQPLQRKPLKRVPIKRKRSGSQQDPSIFEIVTKDGDRYLWPVKWMNEKDWQETVVAWAFHGDRAMKPWHCTNTQESQAGWFDLSIFQPTRKRALFVELKARDRKGESKQPSPWQWEYISAGLACGLDVRVWLWPDDAREAWETLIGEGYVP